MDDLHRRFRRLDRIATPNQWNEAVARAAELEMAPRRRFTPELALIAMALVVAALSGTVAVGALLNQELPVPEIVTYDNGMIVTHEGCGRLVGLDPTTRAVRELVAASADCDLHDFMAPHRPEWSQDGSRLAYLVPATTSDVTGVWVYDAAAGDARQVGECPQGYCYGIDISPDGSRIAYVAECDDCLGSLVVVGVDSGETYRVNLSGSPLGGSPAFSPDGKRIALPLLGGRSGVHVIDVRALEDGTASGTTLLHGIVQAEDVAWSPDGEWIAFTQTGGLGVDGQVRDPNNGQVSLAGKGIAIVRADGTDARVLATGTEAGSPMFPTWSADSASVAYLTAASEFEIWTAAIDGGEPTRIDDSGCCMFVNGGPTWSPDGEWIAFGATLETIDGESGLVMMRPDGSDVQIAPDMRFEPAWQPIPKD